MTARGEGLARHRARLAEELWPKVLECIQGFLAAQGAPIRIPVSAVALECGVPPRVVGVVLRSGGAVAEWMRGMNARLEVVDRKAVLYIEAGESLMGVDPTPAELPPVAPATEAGESWLPSLW